MFRRARLALLAPLALAAFAALRPATASSNPVPTTARTLAEYRDFRALSIDLLGRIPTRDELAQLERSDFDRNAWIGAHVGTAAYAKRLTRVYMDLLRLEVSNAVTVTPQATTLRRIQILGPDNKPLYVYYRRGQRRARAITDGEFCLSKDETGLELTANNPPKGIAIAVKKDALDAATVEARPWWLYRDYVQLTPKLRYGAEWTDASPRFVPSDKLLKEPDGSPTIAVRICREEAQATDAGTVYATGRIAPPKGAPPPPGRTRPLPIDDAYAKAHKGQALSCRDAMAVTSSIDCGCGVGLQYCMPGDSDGNDPGAFMLESHALGIDAQMPLVEQSVSAWHKRWWTLEATEFFEHLFADDRDFRDVLTAKYTWMNGPLAQYYRAAAPASCCGRERAFGMNEDRSPLMASSAVPESLFAYDAGTWLFVPDRGVEAAGLLTMPVFLEKYASRRARAAAVYSAFLCKSFVASDAELTPSTEPNLMVRPGCSSCHATLEPLAAYFSRIEETSAVYLPSDHFPLKNALCKLGPNGKAPGFCDAFYDPSFSDARTGTLRGAYASADHADAGPRGLARAITAEPEFASCAVSRVTASLLGRPLSSDDDALVKSLTATFVHADYRMRPMVVALLASDAYRKANNARSESAPEPPVGVGPDDAVHGATR